MVVPCGYHLIMRVENKIMKKENCVGAVEYGHLVRFLWPLI